MKDKPTPRGYCYEIWFDDTDPLAVVLDEEDLQGIDRWLLYEGKFIETWPKGITFYAEGEHLEDYLAGVPGWIIISDRARQALERCQVQGVQFLPVQVIHKEQRFEIGPYWVLNVTQAVEALDWEHTRWAYPETKYEDEYPILNIIKEALQWNMIKDLDVFLLKVKHKCKISIYISERVKSCLENAGATSGFKFIPVPAY